MKVSSKAQKIIVFSLVLLAFLLRAYRLNFQSFWIDEAWTVYFTSLSIGELWDKLQTREFMPPFYFFTALHWVKLVGNSEYGLRLYSTIFGVVTVPLAYRLGKDLGDGRLGLLTGLLMTVAPYQIWHSQDARMYAIFTASSVMSMWGFINFWRKGGWRWWLVHLIGTEWMLLTHYHGLVLIGVQGLFLLITWRRHWRGYLTWGGTLLLLLLLYTPWLISGSVFTRSFRSWWIEQPTLWEALTRSARAYSVGELVPPAQAIPLTSVFIILYIVGLAYTAGRRWGSWPGPEVSALLALYTVVPILVTWLYGELLTTVYFERYLILVQTGYLLTVAGGVLAIADGLHKRFAWGAPILASTLALLLIGIDGWVLSHHYFDPAYAKPDWRAVARSVEDFGLPGDAIIITGDGGEKVFDYYYQGNLPIYLDFNTPVPPKDEARQIIADIVATHRRVWYTPYGVDIDATLESWLADNAYPAWQSWIGRKRLALYGGSAAVADRHETLDATFGDSRGSALTLVSAALPSQATPAGNLLPLSLTWLASTELKRDHNLSLRLSNDRGDVFAQSDWPPLATAGHTSSWQPDQPITDHRGLWLPPDIPPGDYVLQLVVYDPASGQPLGQPATIPNVGVGPAETVVPPEALPIPNPAQQRLGDLTLVGYALPESVRPGEEMWLWLYWQVSADETPTLPGSAIRLSLMSEGEFTSTESPLVDSVGSLASWGPGQVRRTVYHLPTSPRLPGDEAEVRVTLLSAEGQIEAETTLAHIELEQRPRQFEVPSIAHSTDIAFGQPTSLKLIGYQRPSTDLTPGDTLPATLYWQAVDEMNVNYTVFVQLLDDAWQVVAQQDLQPRSGAAPTTTWLPGEILTDPYNLSLPTDLPAGEYRLIAGMYNPATGERLPVSTGSDFVDLGTVTVDCGSRIADCGG